MTRRVYDANRVIVGAANESPLLLMLPPGAVHIVASLCTEAEWRSKWVVDGNPLTDGQWDVVEAVAAGIYRAIEDGENVDELSNAVRYLADQLKDSRLNLSGYVGGGCCGSDAINDPGATLDGRGDGWDYIGLIEAIGDAIVDSFTDDGSNFPPGFEDRAGYELAKCSIANQYFKDFKTTLVQLQILDVIGIVATAVAMGTALFSSGGALAGMVAAGVAAPVAALTLIAFFLSIIVLGINVGARLKAIGGQLDQQSFVCALYAAEDTTAARAVLISEVSDALDRAIAAGTVAYSELFEERLLELLEVLVPSESLEALFSIADAASQAIVASGGSLDCSTACSGTVGGQLLTVTDFEPYDGQSMPDLLPFNGQIGNWYRVAGNDGGTGGSLDVVGDELRNNAAGSSAAAVHEFILTQTGDLHLNFWRSGSFGGANVIFYLEEWVADAWVIQETLPASGAPGYTEADVTYLNVAPGLYRARFRLNGEDDARFRDPSLLFIPA